MVLLAELIGAKRLEWMTNEKKTGCFSFTIYYLLANFQTISKYGVYRPRTLIIQFMGGGLSFFMFAP